MVELILVAMLLSIIAIVAVPKLQYALVRKQQAEGVAQRLASQLRLTRRLAISNAAQNVTGYALNMTGTEPYSGYQIVNLDTADVVDSASIDEEVTCTGGAVFEFGPLGALSAASDTQLNVTAEGRSIDITIVAATGYVQCTEN